MLQKKRFLLNLSVSRKREWILNTTEANDVQFDLCNVNLLFQEPREGCAVDDPLMLQNRRSSAESTLANTNASVSRHRLDSSGKSLERVSKK